MASVTFGTGAPAAGSRSEAGTFGFFKAINRWNTTRKTRNALNGLTDRQLYDIGLVRGDINDIAVGQKSAK